MNGVQYDVTTFTGTYNANSSKFATPANGGVMPWWDGAGTGTLAQAFATKVGLGLGLPNSGSGGSGPVFGYRVFGGIQNFRVNSSGTTFNQAVANGTSFTYAQATLYTPPAASVPGPLPLFGAAAALGFSRKLRKRIQVARMPQVSNLPLA